MNNGKLQEAKEVLAMVEERKWFEPEEYEELLKRWLIEQIMARKVQQGLVEEEERDLERIDLKYKDAKSLLSLELSLVVNGACDKIIATTDGQKQTDETILDDLKGMYELGDSVEKLVERYQVIVEGKTGTS